MTQPRRDDPLLRARLRLLAAIALVMAANGLLLMLFSVRATRAGFGSTVTALIIGGYYGGFLAASVLASGFVRRSSTSRTFVALSLSVATVSISAPLLVWAPFWLFLRALQGFAFAAVYVVAESWLNRATPNEERARVLGQYLSTMMASFAAGTLIVVATGTHGVLPFGVAGALACGGALLVRGLPEPGGAIARSQSISFRSLVRRVPLGTSSAVVTSIANAAFVSSLAVWATRVGYSEARTSLFSTLGSLGPVLLQAPITRWSDRSSRPRVMFAVTLLAAAAAIGGMFGPTTGAVPLVGVLVLGGLSYTQYSLFGAETNDQLTEEEMPSASGHLILLTGIGAIIGSVAVGVAFRWLGNDAMFWIVAVAHLVVAVLVVATRRRRQALRLDRQSIGTGDFQNTTLSLPGP